MLGDILGPFWSTVVIIVECFIAGFIIGWFIMEILRGNLSDDEEEELLEEEEYEGVTEQNQPSKPPVVDFIREDGPDEFDQYERDMELSNRADHHRS